MGPGLQLPRETLSFMALSLDSLCWQDRRYKKNYKLDKAEARDLVKSLTSEISKIGFEGFLTRLFKEGF